jgi:hypothetical protein
MLLHVTTPHLAPDTTEPVHADCEVAEIAPAARVAAPPPVLAPQAATRAASALPVHAVRAVRAEDSLAREAELVAEARGAVVRGEPAAALGALRATRALPMRALEPEELSIEIHALRALGRTDEADDLEERLQTKFPEHALSR